MPSDPFIWFLAAAMSLGTIVAFTFRRISFERRLVRDSFDYRNATADERQSAEHKSDRDALIGFVLLRATELGIEVAVSVKGTKPAIVTYHPTDRELCLYPDEASYEATIAQSPIRARFCSVGDRPAPVTAWSHERLQRWLDDHRQS